MELINWSAARAMKKCLACKLQNNLQMLSYVCLWNSAYRVLHFEHLPHPTKKKKKKKTLRYVELQLLKAYWCSSKKEAYFFLKKKKEAYCCFISTQKWSSETLNFDFFIDVYLKKKHIDVDVAFQPRNVHEDSIFIFIFLMIDHSVWPTPDLLIVSCNIH